MSMLSAHTVCGGPRRILVRHGAAHLWGPVYRSDLEVLQQLCPDHACSPTTDWPDDEPVSRHGHAGRARQLWHSGVIQEAWGRTPDPSDIDVSPLGMRSMIDLFTTEGVVEDTHQQPGPIHIERP